jgi:AcrR family transcriptional regulator
MSTPSDNGSPEVPTLREAKRELVRSRFVAAATAAFAAKPYSDVTVDDISRRAGTSRATFYLYYPVKLRMLLDCLAGYEAGTANSG